LGRVTQDAPRNFSAWFVRGNCCYDLLQDGNVLSAALRAGFGLDFVDHDTDLDALRNLPEFRGLVAAARALHARPLPPR
jgi:hypothetical protein